MATVTNLTISDTGYIATSSGTSAQRPGVSATGTATPLSTMVNGLQLYNGGSQFQYYQNLPDYLHGAVCTTNVNDVSITFTISANCTAYQIADSTWTQVSHVGWTAVSTAQNYITGYSSTSVWSQALTPGSYSFSGSSAMYAFVFPTLAGTIRYNSTAGMFEGYTGQTWTPLTSFLPNANSGTVFTAGGTYTVPVGTRYVNVLVVGGGGGGGCCMGGGGGGGGVRYVTNLAVPPGGTVPVGVGGGGGGSTGRGNGGALGTQSNFGGIIAAGGGGGASWDGNTTNGSGATGGGANQGNTGQRYGNNPAVYPPQGFPGGSYSPAIVGSHNISGGGGGAGGPGAQGTPFMGGPGGSGQIYNIGGAYNGGASGYYSGSGAYGGGGGASANNTNGVQWGRGTDGGSDGAYGTASAAVANTGGGGGGGGYAPDGPGGAGASGIVIVQPVTSISAI